MLRSGHVAQGSEVAALEDELAARFRPGGACAVVSSGTAALRLAFEINGFAGNVPTYACAAIYHAAYLQDWRTLLVDCDVKTFNSPNADVVVHTYGVPCSVQDDKIEDFTHASGASLNGKPCGSSGALSVISFGATKPLGIGSGGAVLGPTDAIEDIRDRRDYDGKPDLRERFNYQLGDVYAAIGRERLRLLDEENQWRAEAATLYAAFCPVEIQGVGHGEDEHGPHRKWDLGRIWYRFVIRVPDWRKAQAHFSAAGIETINPLMPEELLHRKLGLDPAQFPNAEEVARTTLSLPIWPGMTDEQTQRVADVLAELRP